MTDIKHERLTGIVSTYEEMLFERFDRLHSEQIDDSDVIRYLRSDGHTLLATRYIEWGGCLDPDSEGGDESDVVPDPADAPSYAGHPLNQPAPGGMIASLEKHLDSWESQGHATVGIAFLRRHFGLTK